MTGWELFVKDFHETQWPVWFLAVAMVGYWLGWKACKLWHFNQMRLKAHETRILRDIDEAQKAGKWPFNKAHIDPFTKKPFVSRERNDSGEKIRAGAAVARSHAGGIVPANPASDMLMDPLHPLNPITDPFNVYHSHDSAGKHSIHEAPASAEPAPTHHHDTPSHHSDPVPDCTPSHDSGSSGGGYDSGSSSSDCGSSSSDSGGGSSDSGSSSGGD